MFKLIILFSFLIGVCSAQDVKFPLHSHNDYEQKHPLIEAFTNNFRSIEVDIWLSKGELKVSHNPWNFKGTLEEMYLAPLQRLVDSGKLKADAENPLLLWIDIKDIRTKIIVKLARILEKYPMVGKEVTIILTGSKRLKRRFVEDYPHINVERDEGSLDDSYKASTPCTWLTLKWSKYFEWNGEGEMSAVEKEKLKNLVESIHASGHKLRFHASPANESYWKLMTEMKVDLIDTDNIQLLEQFWKKLIEPLKLPPN
jgi:alkaline phosphatase